MESTCVASTAYHEVIMEITDIPFAQTIGLQKNHDGALMLDATGDVMNHLQTIAAAAQFSLAELASGEHLIQMFPDLIADVIPVLRDSRLKYKRPANSTITAHAATTEKDLTKFWQQFDLKGRGLLQVRVDVKDSEGQITCSGTFIWYIQKR